MGELDSVVNESIKELRKIISKLPDAFVESVEKALTKTSNNIFGEPRSVDGIKSTPTVSDEDLYELLRPYVDSAKKFFDNFKPEVRDNSSIIDSGQKSREKEEFDSYVSRNESKKRDKENEAAIDELPENIYETIAKSIAKKEYSYNPAEAVTLPSPFVNNASDKDSISDRVKGLFSPEPNSPRDSQGKKIESPLDTFDIYDIVGDAKAEPLTDRQKRIQKAIGSLDWKSFDKSYTYPLYDKDDPRNTIPLDPDKTDIKDIIPYDILDLEPKPPGGGGGGGSGGGGPPFNPTPNSPYRNPITKYINHWDHASEGPPVYGPSFSLTHTGSAIRELGIKAGHASKAFGAMVPTLVSVAPQMAIAAGAVAGVAGVFSLVASTVIKAGVAVNKARQFSEDIFQENKRFSGFNAPIAFSNAMVGLHGFQRDMDTSKRNQDVIIRLSSTVDKMRQDFHELDILDVGIKTRIANTFGEFTGALWRGGFDDITKKVNKWFDTTDPGGEFSGLGGRNTGATMASVGSWLGTFFTTFSTSEADKAMAETYKKAMDGPSMTPMEDIWGKQLKMMGEMPRYSLPLIPPVAPI